MNITSDGAALIKSFEGCRLIAYKDAVGVLTVGYGHTGPDVKVKLEITQEQADEIFAADLARFAVGVRQLIKVNLTDAQFSAVVSLAYNIGLGNLAGSTLLRFINAGDLKRAADQFPRWNKAGGKPLAGLTRRRAAERAMFLGESV